MATTPLRPYIREIESMIDQGQTDEAIAHSRHILQVMPKNLAAYRLLGKAFLETQRYGDAADIFLRVLSSVPDDFVSHVGMSIIREDEGHQDAAIWHMERAFEVQPYNSAIQDELRRLYGKRDGIEPPKVRLTRGALARMYARGDLYQQAMGELRSALLEDPQRTDLQVLLARMYYLSGQKVEAVDVCSKLLKKLPNCLEANRIIAAILPETERKDEAPAYQSRVAALDPYLAHAPARAVDSQEVDENVVVVERLDTSLGQLFAQPDQPTWASSLGVAIEPFGSPKDTLPDWLTQAEDEPQELPDRDEDVSLDEAHTAHEASDEEVGLVAEAPEADLPDWMKEAGWEVSESGESQTQDLKDSEADLGETQGDLPQGEIPQWLREMAPPGAISDEELDFDDEGEKTIFPWMEPEPSGEHEDLISAPIPEEILLAASGENADESLVGEEDLWVEKSDEPALDAEEIVSEEIIDQGDELELTPSESGSEFELPDWLSDIEPKSKPPAEEIPEWLVAEQPAGSTEAAAEFELPAWLAGVHSADDEQQEEAEGFQKVGVEGGALEELEAGLDVEIAGGEEIAQGGAAPPAEAELETEFEAALQVEAGEELPDWLEELETTGEEDVPAAELETEFEAALQVEAGEDLPDWLADLETAGEESAPAAGAVLEPEVEAKFDAEFEAALEAEAGEELPDWLSQLEPVGEDQEGGLPWELEGDRLQSSGELPDWLGDIGASSILDEGILELDQEGEYDSEESKLVADEIPGLLEEEPAPTSLQAELESHEAEEVEHELLGAEPVAGEQDAETISPQEEAEVSLVSPGELLGVEETEVIEEGFAPELVDDDAAMAWLEGLAAKHGVPEEELVTSPEERSDQLPDWITGMEIEGDTEEIRLGEASKEEIELPLQDETPSMADHEQQAPAFEEELEPLMEQEIQPGEPDIELPDWLLDIETQETASIQQVLEVDAPEADFEEPVQTVPAELAEDYEPLAVLDMEDEDEAMAWLEGLAAKHGVPEEELISLPEERPVDVPEWVQEMDVSEMEPAEETPEIEDIQEPEKASEWQLEVDELQAPIEEQPELAEPAESEIELAGAELEEVVPADARQVEAAGVEPESGDVEPVAAAREEIPPWLQEMAQGEQLESVVLEWLEDIELDKEAELVGEQAEAGLPLADEPGEGAPAEGEAVELPFTTEEELELPEWLDEEEQFDDELVEEAGSLEQEEAPDWLVEIERERAGAVESAPATEIPEEEDWILAAQTADEPEAEYESPELDKETVLPEWLADLEQSVEEAAWTPPQVEEAELASPADPVKMPDSLLDINQASLIELEATPGIGFRLAQRIIEHRQSKGAFGSLEELEQVPGVSKEIVSDLSGRLYVAAPGEPSHPGRKEGPPSGAGPEWDRLLEARTAYQSSPQEGLADYGELINKNTLLDEVIGDLHAHLQSNPEDFAAWMSLGDALNRSDRPREAMEAYIKAEQLLR
jgi:DNA uptake protein ComE-like DNA-binding protein/cytochrome c-type biogenesis protein CcmH/NrfG